MSDIKIGDIIALPVQQNESRYFGHIVYSTGSDDVIFSAKSSEVAKHIAQAINNHDRLTEEVERLTAQNKELIEMLDVVVKRARFDKARLDNTIRDINQTTKGKRL